MSRALLMEIFIHRDGRDFGPYSVAEVRSRLAEGSLSLSDHAWTEGMTDWLPIASFDGFTATTNARLPLAAAPTRPARKTMANAGISIDTLGTYGRSTLQPNETPLHRTVIHPIVMIGGFIFGGILALFLIPGAIVGASQGSPGFLFLTLVPIAIALPGFITVKTSELLITDRRVIIKVGFLQRRTMEMFISKIESVAVQQPLFGRMFGYGSVIIRGTGGSAETFAKIKAPIEFRNAIQRVQSESEKR